MITYLTQKQPAFNQSDIEKFITYVIARNFSQTEEAKREATLELQLGYITDTIKNLKKILENTLNI